MKTLIAFVLALVLLAPGAASAGEPVTFAYAQLGLLAHLPWSVALGQKYFEEQGPSAGPPPPPPRSSLPSLTV